MCHVTMSLRHCLSHHVIILFSTDTQKNVLYITSKQKMSNIYNIYLPRSFGLHDIRSKVSIGDRAGGVQQELQNRAGPPQFRGTLGCRESRDRAIVFILFIHSINRYPINFTHGARWRYMAVLCAHNIVGIICLELYWLLSLICLT